MFGVIQVWWLKIGAKSGEVKLGVGHFLSQLGHKKGSHWRSVKRRWSQFLALAARYRCENGGWEEL